MTAQYLGRHMAWENTAAVWTLRERIILTYLTVRALSWIFLPSSSGSDRILIMCRAVKVQGLSMEMIMRYISKTERCYSPIKGAVSALQSNRGIRADGIMS